MAFNYEFRVFCRPEKSGVWEQRFEVTHGKYGIKMDVKLNVDVIPMSDNRKKVVGAVEEVKLINWPEGLDGDIVVRYAYCDEDNWNARPGAQYDTEFKGSPPKNLIERPIAYKQVVGGNDAMQTTISMCIDLFIDWLPFVSDSEPDHKLDAESSPNPGLKLKSSDNVCLYLKGDWIDDFSTLLKRYREGWLVIGWHPYFYGLRCTINKRTGFTGNYDQKMSKSDDGCFECPEFDAETLLVLFCYGQYKKLPSWYCRYPRMLNDLFAVMRAADYFGANRACDELFAMETQRLIHKGSTKDNNCKGTNPMFAREYLDLWHHAINYNFPEMKLMLARHTHWFIEKMREDQAIWDEYCKLMAGISEKH